VHTFKPRPWSGAGQECLASYLSSKVRIPKHKRRGLLSGQATRGSVEAASLNERA
jgi:hypothetical protein